MDIRCSTPDVPRQVSTTRIPRTEKSLSDGSGIIQSQRASASQHAATADTMLELRTQKHDSTRVETYAVNATLGATREIEPAALSNVSPPLPLPGLSDLDSQVFLHFINCTSLLLVAQDSAMNPFKELVPSCEYAEYSQIRNLYRPTNLLSVALSEPCLMNIILTISICHIAYASNGRTWKSQALKYFGHATHDLRVALDKRNHQASAAAAATILMMRVTNSIFDLATNNLENIHFRVVNDILECADFQAHCDGETLTFLIEWCISVEALSGTSATIRPLREPHPGLAYIYQKRFSPSTFGLIFSKYHLWGCTLLDLWHLCRLVRVLTTSRNNYCDNAYYHNYLSGIHYDGTLAYWTLTRSEIHHDHEKFSQAYRCASLIHIRRRGMATLSSAPPVQDLVTEIFKIVRYHTSKVADDDNITSPAFMFPLVTAGLEAQSQAHKDFVLLQCRSWSSAGFSHVSLRIIYLFQNAKLIGRVTDDERRRETTMGLGDWRIMGGFASLWLFWIKRPIRTHR